jgi:alcohol dehydrogenase (cytochrome c)
VDASAAYLGGIDEETITAESYLKAIDAVTGKLVWSVHYPSRAFLPGVLSTADRLLFSSDAAGNLVARDPGTGRPLWHSHLGTVSNAPETYLLDGHQFILIASGDMLYAFRLA